MKAWLAHDQITLTMASGAGPASNATAERGVRWYKAKARAPKASPADWPMATSHGNIVVRIAAFGQEVWYKAKAYKGVKEKEVDAVANKDLPVRWKRASYRRPSMDVTEGQKEPEREDPRLLPELQVEEVDDPGPPTPWSRLRGKTMENTNEDIGREQRCSGGFEFFEELTEEQIAQIYMMAGKKRVRTWMLSKIPPFGGF